MKILNTNSNINYGYNIQYHKQLWEKLSQRKQNKEIAKFLIQQDKFALCIEDELIEMEKTPRKTKTEKYQSLADYLIDIKSTTAYTLESCFHSFKYCDNLIRQYLDEMKTMTNTEAVTWRKNLCESLTTYSIEDYPELDKPKKPDYAEIIIEEQNKECALEENAEKKPGNKKQTKTQIPNEISLYIPNDDSPKGLDDVVGLKREKQSLKEDLIDYINNPFQAKLDESEYGLKHPVGYLFYGPPGCGKTYITKALAAETNCPMYKMDVSKVGSKYVNQSANNIQQVFSYLTNVAKDSPKPILLFMDEVDSLARNRSASESSSSEDIKVVTTLLKLLDEAKENNIIVIAATNKFDLLDEAFVNRFDGQYYIGMPNVEQITELLTKLLSKRAKGEALSKDSQAIKQISLKLEGYSNRSIEFLVNEAAKNARRNSRREITKEDFDYAIKSSDLEKIKEKDFKKHSSKTSPIGFAVS